MRRSIAPLFALVALAACGHRLQEVSPVPVVHYGLTYPPWPTGFSEEGGWLVGPDTAITYSLSIISGPAGRSLWLGRFTHHDSLGRANWQLKRQAALPPLPPGYSFVSEDCTLDGRADPRLLVFGRWEGDTLLNVRTAWLANLQVERIDTIPAARVHCAYVGDRD